MLGALSQNQCPCQITRPPTQINTPTHKLVPSEPEPEPELEVEEEEEAEALEAAEAPEAGTRAEAGAEGRPNAVK